MSMGLGFLGAGNMGEAMIRGVLAAKLYPPKRIAVFDAATGRGESLRERYGVAVVPSAGELLKACDTVVIAVKPQVLDVALHGIPKAAARGKTFVSVVAGARVERFTRTLGEGARVVRTMPNTPAQVGMGSTGIWFPPDVDEAIRKKVRALFSSFGAVAEVPREELLDVVTALSGSGPAYAFLFLEALADGAVRAGMGRQEATLLAASTLEGAARMVRLTGKHPAELKDMVMSPGGTTAAGVAALERGSFRATVMEAVMSAWHRCRELSG
ncbi:MAG: pyrroline-5-carboxylate reductase [Deltaproteobacteria bacterium]|jgi:pyrroline-5-carboxylate reductase|nr:pyrroline-5-carboxylate reductase [Deltaproteobacteria bacterium]